MKYVIFLGDGMADTPVEALGGQTPLEAAEHPNMDRMASRGRMGLVRNVPLGMKPGSDTANLSVFGYDPRTYYTGRSPLEAVSIGIELALDDVTYRCNFVTLSGDSLENAVMEDYSAGEISSEESRQLVEHINAKFSCETLHLYPGISYRQCLVLKHGKTGAELTPPHDISGQTTAGRLPEGQNAALLREMMRYAYETLKDHPVNRERIRQGKNPANAIWFWGEGRKPALKPFLSLYGLRGAVISAVDLIQGIGICAGMRVLHVPGATGNYHTDFAAKGRAAIEAFETGSDFVYIHVEAPDECGHQNQVSEKVYSIEQIDEKIIGPVLSYLQQSGEAYAALVLPDHPTPLALRTHTGDPVPFALYRSTDEIVGNCVRYTEESARATGIFVPRGDEMIRVLLGEKTL